MGLWDAQWDELLVLSGRKPFLDGPVWVRHDGAETVLSVHGLRAVMPMLIVAVVATVFVACGILLRFYAKPVPTDVHVIHMVGYVAMGIGALTLVVSLRKVLSILFSTRQVRLTTQPPQVTVVRG